MIYAIVKRVYKPEKFRLDIFFMKKKSKKKILVEFSLKNIVFHNEVLHCIFFLMTSFAPQWTENVKKSWPKLTRKRWMLQLPSPSEKLRHSCLNSTDLRSFYLTRYLLCSLCEWFISHNIVIHTVIHMHGKTHPPTHTCTYLHHILTELCELVMFYQMWTTKCMIQRLWAYIYWACASERGGHRLYYTWHYYRLKDWPNNFSCETCRPKHSGTCVKGCNSPLTNEAIVILDMFGIEMYLYLFPFSWGGVCDTEWCCDVCRLEEAEERFRNRESRQEDLDLIQQLKQALAEREMEMKKLVVCTAHKITT